MTDSSTWIFDGGIYRVDELVELIEDVGGFILRREDFGVATKLVFLAPRGDLRVIDKLTQELGGTIKSAPLAGSEIAVVAPSMSNKHMPHPTCDIAEFMRRNGAQTNIIGLARGFGQNAYLTFEEERLINEHDLALFVLGNSKFCLVEKKLKLFQSLKVPVIVVGAPHIKDIRYVHAYIGGFGRKALRLKKSDDIKKLDKLLKTVERCLDEKRAEIAKVSLTVSPIEVKQAIEFQIPEIRDVLSPSPITTQLDGIRLKLPYDQYSSKISLVKIEGKPLQNFANIIKSMMNDYILIKMVHGVQKTEDKNIIEV